MFSHFSRNQVLDKTDDGYFNPETYSEGGNQNDSCNTSMGHGFEDTHYHSVHSCSGGHETDDRSDIQLVFTDESSNFEQDRVSVLYDKHAPV